MKLVLCPMCDTPVIASPIASDKGSYSKKTHIYFHHNTDLAFPVYQPFLETAILNWLYNIAEGRENAITMHNRTVATNTGRIQSIKRYMYCAPK